MVTHENQLSLVLTSLVLTLLLCCIQGCLLFLNSLIAMHLGGDLLGFLDLLGIFDFADHCFPEL